MFLGQEQVVLVVVLTAVAPDVLEGQEKVWRRNHPLVNKEKAIHFSKILSLR